MRRLLPALAALVVVALSLTAATPASAAAPLTWSDPAKDSGFHLAFGAPVGTVKLPVGDDPSLDVTAVRVETKGTNLVWTATIAKLAATNPSTATGIKFIFGFTYGTGTYSLAVIDDLGYGKKTELRGGTLGSTNPTACGKCIGMIDRKTSKVVFTTPITSLSSAFRTAVPGSKTFTTGSKLEKLSFNSARSYGAGTPDATASIVTGGFHNTFTADDTAPPANATFTV